MTQCQKCRFWIGHSDIEEAVMDAGLNLGQCRRRSPAPVVTETVEQLADGFYSAYWPETFGKDSCGEGEQT